MHVAPTELIPGDVDLSFTEVDIADLVYLVDFMFTNGDPPPALNTADVDASCNIDISDLVYMVDFMFTGGPIPVIGCVVGKMEWPGPLSGGGR